MSKQIIILFGCMLFFLTGEGGISQSLFAAIPNADSMDTYTEKQFRKDFLAYNRRTLSEAYREVGQRDPRWDDRVIEYLEGQAVRFTNYGAELRDQVPVVTDEDRMNELARQVQDLGCTDPLVRYVNLIYLKTEDDDYLQRAQAVYEAMLTSAYPINRKLHAAWRLMIILEGRGMDQRVQEIEPVWVDLMCQAVQDPARSLEDQYYLFWAHREALMDDAYLPRWALVCQRIDVPTPQNPWLVGAICGYHHKQMAWKLRGNGWARDVTEEGWRGFRSHLTVAREQLIRAWDAAPQFPDVPSEMISVSMGLDNNEERMWFDRAVQARFDYYPAYHSYLWSIRPRWGGSLNLMYSFGVECLETHRFDTRVPSIFYKAMDDIADESGYGAWIWPNVYDQFITYFEGQKNEPKSDSSPQWWESMKAVVAWRVGRYEQATQWMDGLGEAFIPRTFTRMRGDPVLGPSECYARVSVPEAVFDEARQLWMDDKYRGASEVFEKSIAEMQAEDPARPYLRHLSVWARRLHQQERGTWIDLLGEPDLVGWKQVRGEWAADEQGRLTGTSTKSGLKLECRFGLGYHVEVEGTITFPDDPAPEEYNGGLLMAFRIINSKHYHRSVLMDRASGDVETAMNFGWRKHYPAKIEKTNTFNFQMWDEYQRLVVNDQVVFEGLRMRDDLPGKVYPFAIGGRYNQPGAVVRFDELKARRLTLKPDWVPAPPASDSLSWTGWITRYICG